MSRELTFKQAVLLAIIPAAISGLSAYFAQNAESSATKAEQSSSKIELMQAIRQARLTERDLINHDAIKREKIAYLIPVADNRAWGNYFNCRKGGGSRYDCAKNQKQIIPELTPEIVSKELEGGY